MVLPIRNLFFMGPIPALFPTLGVDIGGPTQKEGGLTFLGLPKGQLSLARAQSPQGSLCQLPNRAWPLPNSPLSP